MTKRTLITALAVFIIVLLFAGFFQSLPISISFGQANDANVCRVDTPLQPGYAYFVQVRKPIGSLDGVQPVQCGYIGSAFVHDGKRKDTGEEYCGGDIKTLLQDSGYKKYKCVKCGKVWDQIPAGK